MSDPVTNVEIEDVLSSIRRLVAENAKAAGPEALVLTPDHRVASVAKSVPESQAEPAIAEVAQTPVVVSEVAAPIASVAMAEEAVQADAAALDAKLSDIPEIVNPRRGRIQFTPANSAAATADISASAEPAKAVEPKPEQKPAPQIIHSGRAEPLVTRTVPSIEEAQTLMSEPLISDGDSVDVMPKRHALQTDAVDADVTNLESAQPVIDMPRATAEAVEDVPAADPHLDEATVEAIETKALEETITELETSVAGQEDDWETDDVFQSDNDPVHMFGGAGAAQPAAEIDQSALREMVVDMVRQELRGPLGEKITRNVRKLVRREIQRALTSQDLD